MLQRKHLRSLETTLHCHGEIMAQQTWCPIILSFTHKRDLRILVGQYCAVHENQTCKMNVLCILWSAFYNRLFAAVWSVARSVSLWVIQPEISFQGQSIHLISLPSPILELFSSFSFSSFWPTSQPRQYPFPSLYPPLSNSNFVPF